LLLTFRSIMKVSSVTLSALIAGLSPALIIANGNAGGGFQTCNQQSACMKINMYQSCRKLCGAECEIKVCIELDFTQDGCNKSGTVSHICTQNADDVPEQCFVNPFNFDGTHSQGNVPDKSIHCVQVKPGDYAVFILKDGGGFSCSALTSSFPSGAPGGTTCTGTTELNYNDVLWNTLHVDSSEIESCSGGGNGNLGGECIWKIPTSASEAACKDLPTENTSCDARGDPHFHTWRGHRYSYHGSCDLVLIHSDRFGNGKGLDLHIRTRHRGSYSYISSAALRIGEDDIFEVSAEKKSSLHYLNGVANVALPATIAGYEITHSVPAKGHSMFTIHVSDTESIIIKTWRDFVSVSVNDATWTNFGDSIGLMGDFNTGDISLRDGTHVPLIRGKNMDLNVINAFGQDWQVRHDDIKLFQTLQMPQHPQECTLPTKTEIRRRLGEGISFEAAEAACAHVPEVDFDFCVFDVMAMNDVDAVGAY
jgi:von Willebrand factor type D domain